MKIILTITALAEISAGAASAVTGAYGLAGFWVLAAVTSVGWALAETSAQAWKRKAEGVDRPTPTHVHRASCHGPIGELQCESWWDQ